MTDWASEWARQLHNAYFGTRSPRHGRLFTSFAYALRDAFLKGAQTERERLLRKEILIQVQELISNELRNGMKADVLAKRLSRVEDESAPVEPEEKPLEIKRICSRCRKPFLATSPFIRICDTCKSSTEWWDY